MPKVALRALLFRPLEGNRLITKLVRVGRWLRLQLGFILLALPLAALLASAAAAVEEMATPGSNHLGSDQSQYFPSVQSWFLTCLVIFLLYFRDHHRRSSNPESFFREQWQRTVASLVIAFALWLFLTNLDSLLLSHSLLKEASRPVPFWSLASLAIWWASPMVAAARNRSATESTPLPSTPFDTVVRDLRRRAARLRAAAGSNVVMIVFTLLMGFVIFASAGRRAAIESNPRSVLDLEFFDIYNRTLASVDNELLKLTEEQSKTPMPIEVFKLRVDLLNQRKADIKARFNEQRGVPTTPEETNTVRYVVNFLGSKLGSVVVLIFLVQILVSLYRYNVRLAAFNDSRADLLQTLPKGVALKVKDSMEIFPSQTLTFGKEPSTPLKELADVAVAALSSAKGKATPG
jgi:hypothetical protein